MQTETGTPVQYLQWNEQKQGWHIRPAVIFSVNQAAVNILVYDKTMHYVMQNVLKDGQNCWRHLPQIPGGQFENFIPKK